MCGSTTSLLASQKRLGMMISSTLISMGQDETSFLRSKFLLNENTRRMNAFGCQARWLAMIFGCCYCRKYWTCDDLQCLQPMSLKTVFFQTRLVGRFFSFAVCSKNQPVCNQEMSYRLLQVCVATAWCMKVLCPSFKFSGIATIFTPKV